jgi:hypothetical protein
MRSIPLALGLVGAVCVIVPGPSFGQPPSDPRVEIDGFAAALDAAVRRVSRPSPALLGGGARGYRLPGFGALFVLPPRALPSGSSRSLAEREAARSLDDAIRHLEQGMRTVSSPEIQAQMEKSLRALRQTRAELRGTSRDRSAGVVVLPPPAVIAGEDAEPGQLRLENLQRALESQMAEQMRALHEAERSHGEQEEEIARRMEAQVRELQARMEALRRDVERARADVERQVEMQLVPPAPPEAPSAPAAPAPPAGSPEREAAPGPPGIAVPPWQMWFGLEEPGDVRTGEAVIRDVKAAVTSMLERQGAALHQLRPAESIAVAVDFVPRLALGGRRAQKTLVVKARKRDLDERQAGRLGADEFRQRIEYAEY